MRRTHYLLGLCLTLCVPASAQTLYWLGTSSGTPFTAGGGVWNSGNAVWSASPLGGSPTAWDGTNAEFRGPGGVVTMNDFMEIQQMDFNGAGSYVFDTTGGVQILEGAGVLNGAGQSFTGSGSLIFSGASSSGAAAINSWSGTLQFGTPGSAETANAGTSPISISSNGSVKFSASATGPAATITNAGMLAYEENATSPGTTVANTGNLDLTGLSGTGISLASLINDNAGVLDLQRKTLTLSGGLTFKNGNNLDFAVNSQADHGLIRLTGGTLLGNPGTNGHGTTVNLSFGSGSVAPGSYPLIDFSAPGVTVSGLDAGDFLLGSLPASLAGSSLQLVGNSLVFQAIPEPVATALVASALLGFGFCRNRRRGRD